MNARQAKKYLKKRINHLESDNKLMHSIIADSPGMQNLYNLYNKPLFITHTTMTFQKFKAQRTIPDDMQNFNEVIIEHIKQELARDLFEGIKESIVYEVDTAEYMPMITASIFVGRK